MLAASYDSGSDHSVTTCLYDSPRVTRKEHLSAVCLLSINADILHALQTPICINADIARLLYLDAKPWRRIFFPFPSTDGGDLIS